MGSESEGRRGRASGGLRARRRPATSLHPTPPPGNFDRTSDAGEGIRRARQETAVAQPIASRARADMFADIWENY
ncbi:MAG: hypothetical protein MUC60_10695 [Oscillatoria sp. Prado101]|nr:hypothetical protein [Oscillatoria sp. Prado101]